MYDCPIQKNQNYMNDGSISINLGWEYNTETIRNKKPENYIKIENFVQRIFPRLKDNHQNRRKHLKIMYLIRVSIQNMKGMIYKYATK